MIVVQSVSWVFKMSLELFWGRWRLHKRFPLPFDVFFSLLQAVLWIKKSSEPVLLAVFESTYVDSSIWVGDTATSMHFVSLELSLVHSPIVEDFSPSYNFMVSELTFVAYPIFIFVTIFEIIVAQLT